MAIITHVAFYVGWPKGWAAFSLAKDVWKETADKNDAKAQHQASMIFPIGKPNDAFAKYFVGQSYLAPISMEQVGVFNVTFEPGCRNNWHIHHADKGGGQIFICVAGRGYYQEWGKDIIEMNLETVSIFLSVLSTGMVQRRIAGFLILQLKFREKMDPMNG